ncbi:hypothetical protein [Sulfitobacter mediterraneus]|nr:hypothetical protein [Sulfitobacter mediterraneus]
MTPHRISETISNAKARLFAAVVVSIGWVVAADYQFRETQSLIDAQGNRF